MKNCDKCKVKVRGQIDQCPLCGGNLNGKDDSEIYPQLTTVYKQFELFFKLLVLGTVSGAIISVAVNLVLNKHGYWSIFTVLGIACFWVCVALGIRKRHNIPMSITNQVVVLSLLSILWDYITTWHGWSLDYVIPILCSIAMIALNVISKVLKMPVSDYIVALLADVCFGIIPMIFYFTGVLHTVIPTIICITISLISFAAMIVFEGKNMKLELSKCFHL